MYNRGMVNDDVQKIDDLRQLQGMKGEIESQLNELEKDIGKYRGGEGKDTDLRNAENKKTDLVQQHSVLQNRIAQIT